MTARRLILCLTTVMVLSACGEGGGNDTPSATESLAIETYVGSELSPDEQRCILEGAEVLDIELGRITADDLTADEDGELLAIVALMWVAGATVHWENGFMSAKDGIELNFIYAILAIGVATIGPGEYSLDHALDLIEDLDGVTGLLIAAVGGVGAALAQLAIFYRPPAGDDS